MIRATINIFDNVNIIITDAIFTIRILLLSLEDILQR